MAFNLKKVLKALLLSSNQPLSVKDIQGVFTRFHEQQTMPLPGIVTDYAAPVETAGPDDVPVVPEESIEAPAVAEDSAAVEEPVEAIVDGFETMRVQYRETGFFEIDAMLGEIGPFLLDIPLECVVHSTGIQYLRQSDAF